MGGVLITSAGVSELVEPIKFALPAYSATTVCEPRASVEVLTAATPPASDPAPATLPSMRKLTVPSGAPTPGATALAVAWKVTLTPGKAGLAEAETARV